MDIFQRPIDAVCASVTACYHCLNWGQYKLDMVNFDFNLIGFFTQRIFLIQQLMNFSKL